jgi:hypothetical protein
MTEPARSPLFTSTLKQPSGDATLPAMIVWLCVQMIALALPAARALLWARFPSPAEQLAAHVMIITQIASSSLLCPLLFRSLRSAGFVMALALPFGQLSGVIAAHPPSRVAAASAYVFAWQLTLTMWCIRRTMRFGLAVSVVASLISLGGALGWYLQDSFPGGWFSIDTRAKWLYGPIFGSAAMLNDASAACWRAWIVMTALLIGTLAIQFLSRAFKLTSTYPQRPAPNCG